MCTKWLALAEICALRLLLVQYVITLGYFEPSVLPH